MKNIALRRSIFLPFILTSFFLLLPNVRADEYTYTIPDDVISFMEDNLSLMQSTVESFISNSDDLSDNYFITYIWNKYYVFIKPLSEPITSSSSIGPISLIANAYYGIFSSDFLSIDFHRSNLASLKKYFTDSSILYYSSYNFYFNDTINNIYHFVYNDNQYDLVHSVNNFFPSIYDLYLEFNSTPPDNTPILTNFYSVAGSKIGWLGEQIVSNYIYLAIIGVFILIFLFEFIRRYFL